MRRVYWLNERVGRVQFALELYNLFSELEKEHYNLDSINEINGYQAHYLKLW
jgi:hypothetical protein